MRTPLGATIFISIILLLDTYIFQVIKSLSTSLSPRTRTIVFTIYWGLTVFSIVGLLLFNFTQQNFLGKQIRTYLFATIIGLFFAKLIAVLFFLMDDIRRGIQWIVGKLFFNNTEVEIITGEGITRSTFLSWLGITAGGTLFSSLVYGFSNKYNYEVKKQVLTFKNLPNNFKGLKIVHISDIHSGSFTNKKAVQHGVDMIMQQNADIILFTGDLVNDVATEMVDFMDVFNQLKAPMGVYSTFGNHDYGDYVAWPDRDATHALKEAAAGKHLLTPLQQKNLDDLAIVHKKLGWNLLMDEHIALKKGEDEIALIGVQNISGKKRFHTYGNLQQAYAGTDEFKFKILMSHDPSHWDAEVLKKYPFIDLMLSGHTHGMQFGVEIPGFKWSPVQYVYPQWGGLYEKGLQKLYVNRGFGFIGYPGRVGILPEITVIELA